MKEYKFVSLENISKEEFKGWNIVQILPSQDKSRYYDMVVISRENKPAQDYVKLNEATSKEILEELSKRLVRE